MGPSISCHLFATASCFCVQTVSLLHLRRLTALTELRLRNTYAAAGEAAVCLLAPMLPPDLVTLDLTVDRAFHQGVSMLSVCQGCEVRETMRK